MSFDFPQQPQAPVRRSGGCGCSSLLFLAMILFAGYYLLSGGPARQGQQPNGQPAPNGPVDRADDIFGPGGDRSGADREELKEEIFGDGRVDSQGRPIDDAPRQMPSQQRRNDDNDWQMNDFEPPGGNTRNPSGSDRDRSSSTIPRSDNDWSIENVDPPTAERETVPPSNPGKGNQDGWEIGDFETK